MAFFNARTFVWTQSHFRRCSSKSPFRNADFISHLCGRPFPTEKILTYSRVYGLPRHRSRRVLEYQLTCQSICATKYSLPPEHYPYLIWLIVHNNVRPMRVQRCCTCEIPRRFVNMSATLSSVGTCCEHISLRSMRSATAFAGRSKCFVPSCFSSFQLLDSRLTDKQSVTWKTPTYSSSLCEEPVSIPDPQ